ncbi:MAG: hypothetical protein U0903_09485 [Planctomycetales bacterium]
MAELTTGQSWKSLFENWPDAIPQKGLVITTFQETIPFVNFLISGGLLLLERDRPDQNGGRKVILSYDAISAVKITDPIELVKFQVMGFQKSF